MNGLHFYRDQRAPFYEIKEGRYNLPAEIYHYHNELSIGLVEKGASQVRCQNEEFCLEEQDLIVFLPQVMHRCVPRHIESWQFSMLYLDVDWSHTVLHGHKVGDQPVLIQHLSGKRFAKLRSLFSVLKSGVSSLTKNSWLRYALMEIFASSEPLLTSPCALKSQPDLRLFRRYLEQHYLEKVTLLGLERYFDTDKYRLIRSFQENYAITPHAYLLQLRLNHAKGLLRQGEKIADVACESGFYDQSHFSKAFRQYCGVTPRIYQHSL